MEVLAGIFVWIALWIVVVRYRGKLNKLAANILGAVIGLFMGFMTIGIMVPTPEATSEQKAQWAQERKAKEEAEARDREAKEQQRINDEKLAELQKDLTTMAGIICTNYVETALKAPASADFGWDKAAGGSKRLDNQTYLIRSKVDAQNSFGAQLRNWYNCKIQYMTGDDADPRNWKLLDLQFDNQ